MNQFKSRLALTYILTLFAIIPSLLKGQIEELKAELKTAQGEERIEVLNALARAYLDADCNKTIYYAYEALNLAKTSGNKIELGNANQYLGNAYEQLSKLDTAIVFLNQSVEIRKEINDVKGLAKSYNALGDLWFKKDDHEHAIENYLMAKDIKEEIGDTIGMGISMMGIGNAYYRLGNYSKSIEYFSDASEKFASVNLIAGIAMCMDHIGMVNEIFDKHDKAIDYYNQALALHEQEGNLHEISNTLNNLGNVYSRSENYDTAIVYYKRGLEVREQIGDKTLMASSFNNIGTNLMFQGEKVTKDKNQKYNLYQQAIANFKKALDINMELGNQYEMGVNMLALGKTYKFLGNYDQSLTNLNKSLELAKSMKNRMLARNVYEELASLYDSVGNYKAALQAYRNYKKTHDSIYNDDIASEFTEMETKYKTAQKESQLKIKDLQLTQNEEVIRRQRLVRNSFIGGFALVLVLAWQIFNSLQRKKKDNKIIAEERDKSEKLLLNTLPAKVVEELKEKGTTEPENFDNVAVYFSDVVGFTSMSSNLEPKLLISELNDIFTAFDDIMIGYQCERIKTIGDAYMAVCGMPEKNPNSSELMIKASMDILKYLNERNAKNELQWRIRIGMHTGKVVGGIVGVRKYIYDVFGDTINTASRMESNSVPMRINVTKTTYDILNDKYEFESRDPIEVKGKGVLHMYFLAESNYL